MQRKKNTKKKRDFIQVTLLLSLLFLYTYYESKRKETALETSQAIQHAIPEWMLPLTNVSQPSRIEVKP